MTPRWPCILIVLCSLLAVATEKAAAITGNEFLALSENSRFTYVVGTLDGWGNVWAVMQGANVKAPTIDAMFNDITRCVVERKMTRGQTQAIVEKYLRDTPGKWHEEMAGLIWTAMRVACNLPI